jgi:cobalt-zinc-cadmium resistance protein CzcA
LLSIGAIDFGIIVDSTVILVENVFRHLREGGQALPQAHPASGAGAPTTLTGKARTILLSALEVDKAIFFSAAILLAAFLPLFTMQGVEGQIFAPMAKTYGYALLGALLTTFTISPVLSAFLLPETFLERETVVVRVLRSGYVVLLRGAIRHRLLTMLVALGVLVGTALVLPRLGTEFLPKLEEGNLWIRASLPPSISLEAGEPAAARIRDILRSYPEVITVITQHGRPDDGTDPAGFYNLEIFAPLKPFEDWPKGWTKERLVATLQEQLAQEFPGVNFNFSQYIQDNVEEAVSGVKGENSVKLFGRDLTVLEAKAQEIKAQLATVRGVQDLGIFTVLGQPNLLIRIDRTRDARYGLAPGDVNAVVQAAVGGQPVTTIFEGERQIPLVVRLLPQYRQNIEAIKEIHVASQLDTQGTTAYVPLRELAQITMETGASYIYRENYARYIPIKFSVRDRDLGSTISEAQAKIAQHVALPSGYRIVWSGEFGSLQEAKKRLAVIVPLSLVLIIVLLYSMFNSVRDSLLALAGIPFAVCGGILGLYLTGENLSVSAAVGFISLFGVAVMAGILLLTYYNQLREAAYPRVAAMRRAAEVRMRPMLMTALSACIGLLPAAMSHGIGSQVQRPLATVVVGGMFLAPVLILVVVPVLCLVVLGAREEAAPPALVEVER